MDEHACVTKEGKGDAHLQPRVGDAEKAETLFMNLLSLQHFEAQKGLGGEQLPRCDAATVLCHLHDIGGVHQCDRAASQRRLQRGAKAPFPTWMGLGITQCWLLL